MSALLLSNTRGNTNALIFSEILSTLGEKPRIAYLPSGPDISKKYFHEVGQFFSQFSESTLTYFGLTDEEWNESTFDTIIDYDALYLAGGNPFTLLQLIKKRKLESIIHIFFEKKFIIATSAGAIVLSPELVLCDSENTQNTDPKGLSVLELFVYPHFTVEQNEEVQMLKNKRVDISHIYGIAEFSGISVHKNTLKFLGEVWKL